ncbi:hypothetical protein [Sphingobacterium sp. HMA12]|uniref:hypothetical protein n=1 Tax=Sphingobacterium sp. HMA12 TaxID=2050894 RepID=UPI000CE9EF84|nr:hypothetical protein [Sphingobacterium sp. HMA12]
MIKKKVLLTAHLNDNIDIEFLLNLYIYLVNENYQVYVNTKGKNLYKDFDKPTSSHDQYDFIFVINRPAFNIKFTGEEVIIYFVNCESDFYQLYVMDKNYDLRFDFGGNNNRLERNFTDCLTILYPEQPCTDNLRYTFDIIFIINHLDTLYKLLWFINSNFEKAVGIYCSEKIELFNPHVTIIKQEQFDQALRSSKLVIGESILLTKALLLEKPVMVVGKQGFGGIVNSTNVGSFLESKFSGRIGGVDHEIIPKNLLSYEFFLMNNFQEDSIAIKKTIENKIKLDGQVLRQKMEFLFASKRKSSLRNNSFIANFELGYFSLTDQNTYMVFNRSINQFLFTISELEYKIVKHLKDKKSFEDIIGILGDININDLEKRLRKLLSQKLINYVELS